MESFILYLPIPVGVYYKLQSAIIYRKNTQTNNLAFTHRGVNASCSCSGEHGNVLAVGTYCYVAVCRRDRLGGASAPIEGGEGRGHIVAAARLQLVKHKIQLRLWIFAIIQRK